MRKALWIGFVIFFFQNCGFAQRKSTVFLAYGGYDEFSFRQNIQRTLNPSFANVWENDWVGPDGTKYQNLNLPFSFELQYTRSLRNFYKSVSGSVLLYAATPDGRENKHSGGSTNIQHFNISVGYQQCLRKSANEKFWLSGYSRGVFRYGRDEYHMNYFGWIDLIPYRKLRDAGASVGINVLWYLPWNLVVSAEVGLTKWVFLYSNVADRDLVGAYYPLKPGNQFDMKLGLGYTFSDRKKPVVSSSRWTGKNTLGFSAAIPFFFDSPDRAIGVHLKESFRSPLAGLHYQRQLKGRVSILAGAYYHRVSYYDRGSFRTMARPGNVLNREFLLAKAGLSYRILSWRPLSINVPLSIAYRNGREEYRVSNILPERGWGRRITDGTHQMNDIGLATGLNVDLEFLKTMQAGFNIDYYYFAFRKDNGKRPTNTGIGTSPHILAVGLSLGYRFGWKPKSSEADD